MRVGRTVSNTYKRGGIEKRGGEIKTSKRGGKLCQRVDFLKGGQAFSQVLRTWGVVGWGEGLFKI